MEQQNLPNSTGVLVLGILSIPFCCCYGIVGIILGVIALVLAKKATALHMENPEMYKGYKNVTTGKILAYIGIGLGVLYFIYTIYLFATLGSEGIMEMQEELLRQYGG